MKNAVIGNNKQKANLIVLGAVPRCVHPLHPSFTNSTAMSFDTASKVEKSQLIYPVVGWANIAGKLQ